MNDAVPNVRFNVFKSFISISDRLDVKVRNEFMKKSKKLQNDQDVDVCYFANNF